MGGVLPDRVRCAIPIATTLKHSPQQIAFDEVGRQAVMADPDWREGDYYDHGQPERGLAVARMIGHITYMSDQSMEEKFARRLQGQGLQLQLHRGFRSGRLPAATRATASSSASMPTPTSTSPRRWTTSTCRRDRLLSVPGSARLRFLVIAFQSDWLYPAYQSREIVRSCSRCRRVDATYCEIQSTYGHDAFLLEIDEQTHLIRHFLEKTSSIDRKVSHERR